MIDEKKLIEDIKEWSKTKKIKWTSESVISLLESAAQISKWIPCNKRLPETTDDYLVTYKNGEIGIHRYNSYESRKFWRFYDSDTVPIAWQPLPDKYVEEGEGGK